MRRLSGAAISPSGAATSSNEAATVSGHAADGMDIAAHAPVGHLLRRAYQQAFENSSRALEALDLTPRQGVALDEIRRHGTLSQAEIGEAIGMEPANVHGLVNRLKKKGFITAKRDPANPRRMRVQLTANGERIADGITTLLRDAEATTLGALGARESQTLITLLRKLVTERR